MLESARLIEVIPVELSQLSNYMRDYDTDFGKYELPKSGKYLMLIFLKSVEAYISATNLFTTIRRATPEKERYYKSRIGHIFELEYTGAKGSGQNCPPEAGPTNNAQHESAETKIIESAPSCVR